MHRDRNPMPSTAKIRALPDVERVVAAGAHAVLVGETLVRAGDVKGKVRELLLQDGR